MLLADARLARRVEAADGAATVRCAEALARMRPELGATSQRVAGGHVIFAGSESPITQAVGLGMRGAVRAGELDRMEAFFRSRGAAVHIELCPLADASLLRQLTARGYHLIDHSNTVACAPGAGMIDDAPACDVAVRTLERGDLDRWAHAVAQGFMGSAAVPQHVIDVVASAFHAVNATCFLAELDGALAGGGVMSVHEGVATLFGQATRRGLRRRGVQTSLIRAGIDAAVRAGCDVVAACTLPGSVSQRNYERQGFRVVYTRSKLRRAWTD